MVRLKSTNMIYLLCILPLWLAVCGLGMFLVPALWMRGLIGVVCAGAALWLCRKVSCLPRPQLEYGELTPLELEVPGPCEVQVYTSERMGYYEFLHRTVELVRPLVPNEKHPILVAVNPKLLQQEGEEFVQIAVAREVESYRRHEQLRAVLGLVLPVLGVALGVEVLILAHRLGWLAQSYLLSMVEPAIAVAALVGTLYLWNKNMSKRDFLMDQAMTAYFTREQLVNYIRQEEALNEKEEKPDYSREAEERKLVHQHYMTERIEHLRAG